MNIQEIINKIKNDQPISMDEEKFLMDFVSYQIRKNPKVNVGTASRLGYDLDELVHDIYVWIWERINDYDESKSSFPTFIDRNVTWFIGKMFQHEEGIQKNIPLRKMEEFVSSLSDSIESTSGVDINSLPRRIFGIEDEIIGQEIIDLVREEISKIPIPTVQRFFELKLEGYSDIEAYNEMVQDPQFKDWDVRNMTYIKHKYIIPAVKNAFSKGGKSEDLNYLK